MKFREKIQKSRKENNLEQEEKDKKTNNSIQTIGLSACLLGFFLIVLKGFTTEYIDKFGILHEKFFLIPVGFLLILIGIGVMIFGNIKSKLIGKKQINNT